jgi:hypothetical protein
MPIFVWVIYPYAIWSAYLDMMAGSVALQRATRDQH